MIAELFISEGHPVMKVLEYVNLTYNSYYYKPKLMNTRGIKPSTHTITISGKRVSNEKVVSNIELLLGQEFVDYGYRKVCYSLRQEHGYVINEKKVYRLMKENKLLNKRITPKLSKRLWVKELVPQPSCCLEYLEFDIKYIYIHNKRKNALCLTVIDVESRLVLGQFLAWSIVKKDVMELFDQIFSIYNLPSKIYVRNDNGSQFVAQVVQDYFSKLKVVQEFTKPATPEQNAHIESYHSIVEKVICRRYVFESLLDAQDTFNRFIEFYNYRRIHSGINYRSPIKYLIEKQVNIPIKKNLMDSCLNCKNNIPLTKNAIVPIFEIDNKKKNTLSDHPKKSELEMTNN